MSYNDEGIAALVSVFDEMQTANLILVDKKVRAALKCLAYYDEFKNVLAYCNRGFDYAAEKSKALVKVGERWVIRLPKSDVSLVALVSNMLVEFDEGADLISFADQYFPSADKQTSFDLFMGGVIEPFKLALVRLVVNGINEEIPLVQRDVTFAANGLAEQTQYLLVALVKGVNESSLPADSRAELLTVLEGFAAALDSRDSLIIKAIWIGLKKALAAAKLCQREIEKTDELLKLYLVVK